MDFHIKSIDNMKMTIHVGQSTSMNDLGRKCKKSSRWKREKMVSDQTALRFLSPTSDHEERGRRDCLNTHKAVDTDFPTAFIKQEPQWDEELCKLAGFTYSPGEVGHLTMKLEDKKVEKTRKDSGNDSARKQGTESEMSNESTFAIKKSRECGFGISMNTKSTIEADLVFHGREKADSGISDFNGYRTEVSGDEKREISCQQPGQFEQWNNVKQGQLDDDTDEEAMDLPVRFDLCEAPEQNPLSCMQSARDQQAFTYLCTPYHNHVFRPRHVCGLCHLEFDSKAPCIQHMEREHIHSFAAHIALVGNTCSQISNTNPQFQGPGVKYPTLKSKLYQGQENLEFGSTTCAKKLPSLWSQANYSSEFQPLAAQVIKSEQSTIMSTGSISRTQPVWSSRDVCQMKVNKDMEQTISTPSIFIRNAIPLPREQEVEQYLHKQPSLVDNAVQVLRKPEHSMLFPKRQNKKSCPLQSTLKETAIHFSVDPCFDGVQASLFPGKNGTGLQENPNASDGLCSRASSPQEENAQQLPTEFDEADNEHSHELGKNEKRLSARKDMYHFFANSEQGSKSASDMQDDPSYNTLLHLSLAQDGAFTCCFCRDQFPDGFQYLTHVETAHSTRDLYCCSTCQQFFTDVSQHVIQDGETHQIQQVKNMCILCGRKFSNVSALRSHMHRHSENKALRCDECDKVFTHAHTLATHLKSHTQKKEHICDTCGKSFLRPEYLKHHMRRHTGERPFVCETCKKSFSNSSNLAAHRRTHTGEKPFLCEVCWAAFTTSSALTVHKWQHTDSRPFQCQHCLKTFTTANTYKQHSVKHTGRKDYKCSDCDKCFTHASSLLIHRRLHTGERPFFCSVCGATFRQSAHLTVHVRQHTGEKPFVCQVCSKAFPRSEYLLKHCRTLHNMNLPGKVRCRDRDA